MSEPKPVVVHVALSGPSGPHEEAILKEMSTGLVPILQAMAKWPKEDRERLNDLTRELVAVLEKYPRHVASAAIDIQTLSRDASIKIAKLQDGNQNN